MRNPKTKNPARTLTRARYDVAVYSTYLWLHDGKARQNATARFRALHVDPNLLHDLRRLGAITSEGQRVGQKHRWTGAPPTPQLIDRLEQLREERSAEKAEKRSRKLRADAAAAVAAALPLVVEPTPAPTLDDLTTDQLLDFRNTCDKLLKLKSQTRLF